MLEILFIKALLTSNIYLPCFFLLLEKNGLDNGSILSAISLGTIAMIAGDFLTSFLVDRFGPKIPIICAACVQSISVFLLTKCTSTSALNIIEILIGLSFPAILGADSKWLRAVCPQNASYEKYNQMTFWGTQVISAGIGALLLRHAVIAHYISAFMYLLGAVLAFNLKNCLGKRENTSLKMTFIEIKMAIMHKYRLFMAQAILLGTLGTSSWLFQAKIASAATGHSVNFIILQLLLPISAFATTFLKSEKHLYWTLFSVLAAFGIYMIPYISSWHFILPILIFASAARGILSIVAREKITAGLDSSAPIATLIFVSSSCAKLVQSLSMMVLR